MLQDFPHLVDRLNERIGRMISWLTLGIVLVAGADVVLRYLFGVGWVFMLELEWHMFGVLFLLGAGYTLKHQDHVRVDLFYAGFSPVWRARVDFWGAVLFLIPMCGLVIWTSLPYVAFAVQDLEGSPNPGGLPLRFLIKSMIPLGFGLLALQGAAQAVVAYEVLRGSKGGYPLTGTAMGGNPGGNPLLKKAKSTGGRAENKPKGRGNKGDS